MLLAVSEEALVYIRVEPSRRVEAVITQMLVERAAIHFLVLEAQVLVQVVFWMPAAVFAL